MVEQELRKLKDQASLFSRGGEHDRAISTLKEVLRLDRGDLDTRKRIGDLYRRLGQQDQAVEFYQAVVGGYAAEGRLAKALAMAKVILQIDPKHQETQRVLSDLYARKSRKSALAPLPEAMAASLNDSVKRPASVIRGRRASKINMPAMQIGLAQQPQAQRRITGVEIEIDTDAFTLESEAEPIAASPSAISASEDVEVDLDDIIAERPKVQAAPAAQKPAPSFAAADDFLLASDDKLPPEGEEIELDVDEADVVDDFFVEEDVVIDVEFLQDDPRAQALVLLDSDANLIDNLVERGLHEIAAKPNDTAIQLGLDPDKLPPIPLFSELSKNAFIELLHSLDVREFAPGEIIFGMGERGETLAVIAAGRVRIEKQKGQGRPIILGRLREGEFFGEMALLGHGERTASVIAETAVEILEIPKRALNTLVKTYPSVQNVLKRFYKEHLLEQLFKTSPLFLPFDKETQRDLFRRFKPLKLRRGEQALVEGKKGSGLFVLVSGRCEVSSEIAGLRMVLAELSEGDVFGEMSLLTGEPAMASVRALSKCSLLKLGKRNFQDLIMSHPQILEMVSALSQQRHEVSSDLLGDTPSDQVKYLL